MAEPVFLCLACRAEIVRKGEAGGCPDCGLTAPLEEIEAEAEAALIAEGQGRLRRLDPAARTGEDTGGGPARPRFTVKL